MSGWCEVVSEACEVVSPPHEAVSEWCEVVSKASEFDLEALEVVSKAFEIVSRKVRELDSGVFDRRDTLRQPRGTENHGQRVQ